MYNNQYNGARNSYGFSPYYSGGSGNGYNRNWNQGFKRTNNYRVNNNQPKKHSGCTAGFSHGDATKPYVRGWKFDKRFGLRNFIAGPNKKTKRSTSKNGREWENWTAKMQTGEGVKLFNCLYDCFNKKVIIGDLGFVMNPKAANGGYVGPYYKRKNR